MFLKKIFRIFTWACLIVSILAGIFMMVFTNLSSDSVVRFVEGSSAAIFLFILAHVRVKS